MTPSPLQRLRKLCLALPEAHEVMAHGEPTFRVRNKVFAMFANANNSSRQRPLADMLRDAYRLLASKRLLEALDHA